MQAKSLHEHAGNAVVGQYASAMGLDRATTRARNLNITEEPDAATSYRRLFASAFLVGGATVGAIVIGMVRSKLLALWVGPAGIGLISLFANVVTFACAVAQVGVSQSATHLIASERDNPAHAISSLMLLTWPLALIGAMIVWIARGTISELSSGSAAYSAAIGLAALGVVFGVVSTSQQSVLQGLRKVGDLARLRIGGALLGSVLALIAVLNFGAMGLAAAVVAMPLGDFLCGWYLMSRIGAKTGLRRATLGRHWRALFRFGAVTLATGVITTATGLFVRSTVVRELGFAEAGLFQAAWSIAVMNATLVLSTLAADYFPALTAIAGDQDATRRLVNQQLHVVLLLASPLLVGIAATAPYLLQLLYSGEFRDAALTLQLHTVGDVFKLLGWTSGYVLLARRDLKPYIFAECAYALVYTLGAALLVPILGLSGAGWAYCAAYAIHAGAMIWFTFKRHDISVSRQNVIAWLALLAAQAAVLIVPGGWVHMAIGLALSAGFVAVALFRLGRLTDWGPAPLFARNWRDRDRDSGSTSGADDATRHK